MDYWFYWPSLDELETTEISTTQSAPSPQAYIASVVQPKEEKHMPTLNKLGQIETTKIIELSSDVGGRIVAASPDYRRGRILSAQQWLLQIDPLPYKAAEAAAHVALMNANMALKNAPCSVRTQQSYGANGPKQIWIIISCNTNKPSKT